MNDSKDKSTPGTLDAALNPDAADSSPLSYALVSQAYGPEGDLLVDGTGPLFDDERGIHLFCRQGKIHGDVYLSPFRDDPRTFTEARFISGKPVEIFSPSSLTRLPIIPNLLTEEGGHYYAIYLSTLLEEGELIAVNNLWGDSRSQVLSEDELLHLLWNKQF